MKILAVPMVASGQVSLDQKSSPHLLNPTLSFSLSQPNSCRRCYFLRNRIPRQKAQSICHMRVKCFISLYTLFGHFLNKKLVTRGAATVPFQTVVLREAQKKGTKVSKIDYSILR